MSVLVYEKQRNWKATSQISKQFAFRTVFGAFLTAATKFKTNANIHPNTSSIIKRNFFCFKWRKIQNKKKSGENNKHMRLVLWFLLWLFSLLKLGSEYFIAQLYMNAASGQKKRTISLIEFIMYVSYFFSVYICVCQYGSLKEKRISPRLYTMTHSLIHLFTILHMCNMW